MIPGDRQTMWRARLADAAVHAAFVRRSRGGSPRLARGGITILGTALILAILVAVVVAGGAFMEPGASWGAWLLWGISVYGSLGLLWMSADPLKEGVEKLKSGGRREATDSFQAGLAFAIAGLAALSYLGYRLYVSMW